MAAKSTTWSVRAYLYFSSDEKQKLPDLIRAFTRSEHCDGLNSRRFWEFVAENPESLHCALRLFSYEGIAGTFLTNVKWFSVNTTVWENASGEKCFVRYRWIPRHALQQAVERM